MNLKKTTLEVPVDKGIPDEHDYVMIGEAHEAPGVMAGDLYVRFMIQPHDVFERKGADLFIEKKIMLLEALTGFTFEITHLDGRVLKIATMPGEVIENGSIKMIRNQGMPFHKDEMGSGNLFVRFKV
jgi:DnaJ family protein A protein 2